MDDHDPIKDCEEIIEERRPYGEYRIAKIEDILFRIHELGLNKDDEATINDALSRAIESYELQDSLERLTAMHDAAYFIMRSPDLSDQRKRTKVMKVLELDRVNKPNLKGLERDWCRLTQGRWVQHGLGCVVGMATEDMHAERIVETFRDMDAKPTFLKSKQEAIEYLAKRYHYQEVNACIKALERLGVKGLPNTWEKVY